MYCQTPAVELIEEKQAKRWLLFAQNNTDQEKEAFLIVQGEGFRRSADRPVIKKVPPKSKVLMITLIPLKNTSPTYTTIFNYDDQLQAIRQNYGEQQEEHINIRPIKDNELTVFIKEDCPKCDRLLSYLNKKRIKYRRLDILKHNKVQEFLLDHLKEVSLSSELIKLPVVFYQGRKYYNIVDMRSFISQEAWRE